MAASREVRKLAQKVSQLERQYRGLAATPQLAHSSIENGAVKSYDAQGSLRAVIGKQWDGTHTAAVVNGPTPPTPLAPQVDTDHGELIVRWDGRFGPDPNRTVAPMDFAYVAVHASQDPQFQPVPTTTKGHIVSAAGGEVTIGVPEGSWTVRLQAVSQAGKFSAPSDPVTVDVAGFGSIVLDHIDAAVTEIDNASQIKLDAQETLGGKLAEADQALSDMDGKLSTLETDVLPDMRADLDAAEGRLDDVQRDITDVFGELDEVPGLIEAAKGEAEDYADALPKVLHGTTEPTGTAPDGSIWWMHDGTESGPVVGQWNRVGGSWVSTPIASEAIANLDVGKLTAGAAEIAELVSKRIAAAVGEFVQLDVGNLTATGQSVMNDLAAQRIAAETAEFINLSVGNLVAESGELDEAVIRQLFTEVVVAEMSIADAFIGSNAILDESIKAPHIVASEELWAKVIGAHKIQAEEIAAGAIDGMTITAPTVQTSKEHPKTMLAPTGIHITNAEGADIVHMTAQPEITGGNFLGIQGPDGNTLINLSDEGTVSAEGVNVSGDPVIAGQPLLGEFQEWDAPAKYPMVGWFDRLPRGVVAYGRQGSLAGWNVTDGEFAIMELQCQMQPDRNYLIVIDPVSVSLDGGKWADMLVRYAKGTQPTLSSPVLTKYAWTTYGESRNTYTTPLTFRYSPSESMAGDLRFLISYAASGKIEVASTNSTMEMTIIDIGPDLQETSIRRPDNSGGSPPPAKTKKNYTKTYWANNGRTWQNGSIRDYDTKYIYQGAYGGRDYQSIATFPSMTGDLSGADITSIRVKLKFYHWYYNSGGTAKIMLHGASSLPPSRPSLTLAKTVTGWPKPGELWVDIPSQYWNGFKTGQYRGIGLGDGTGSLIEYGYATWSSARIEIKYRK